MKTKKAKSNKALKAKANKVFSQYIRMKYADKLGQCTCFTCGVTKPWQDMQCGHGISGRGNYVLYLEEVCRPQCASCNIFRHGVYDIFVPKLVELYTLDQYQKWVAESKIPMKRTAQDYQDIIDYYNRQLIPLIDGIR